MRTLYQTGTLDNIKQEMQIIKLSILGISETRWMETGTSNQDGMKFIYSREKTNEEGVGILFDVKTAHCVSGYVTAQYQIE